MYRSRATFKTVPSTTLISTVHIYFLRFSHPPKRSPVIWILISPLYLWGNQGFENSSKLAEATTLANSRQSWLPGLSDLNRQDPCLTPFSRGERLWLFLRERPGSMAWDIMLVDIFSSTGDGRMSVSGQEKCLNASFPEHRGCYLISFLPKPAEECYKSLWLKTP